MNIIDVNLKFGNLTKRKATNRIIFHHSGVTVLQSIETIHNYHKNSNGWAGIGYHFYIRKDGKIYQGRPIDVIGAHAYGSNNDSIGICFEGNFDKEEMTDAQIKAREEIVFYLKNKYPKATFCGHKDVCKTSCPGKNFKFDIKATKEPTTAEAYLVKVTAKVLNIRQGAGTNYSIVGQIKDKGTYTIVDEKDGKGAKKWGKLKSGAGWISLDYTRKLK